MTERLDMQLYTKSLREACLHFLSTRFIEVEKPIHVVWDVDVVYEAPLLPPVESIVTGEVTSHPLGWHLRGFLLIRCAF